MPSQEKKPPTNTDYLVHLGDRSYPVSKAEIADLDLIDTGQHHFHLLHQNQGYQVVFRGISEDGKKVHLRVNERDYEATVSDGIDQLVQQMGLNTLNDQAGKDVYSPMPGLILEVLVSPGQEIEAGMPLLILEAMKMENILRAERKSTVSKVNAAAGDSLAVDEVIMEFE
ncbi:MAG: biotin/lipoyl-containing protein [Bacteroidota bacterium]